MAISWQEVGELRLMMLNLMERSGGIANLELLRAELGLSRGSVLGHLAWLCRRGLVEKRPEGYFLTQQGSATLASAREALGKILRVVEPERAFYFYAGWGRYLGLKASNLAEFCDIVGAVSLESVEFHAGRGDFEAWIRLVLGDRQLADRIAEIVKKGLKGEDLRSELVEALKQRYRWLKRVVGS